jgi:hypothetical protein
MYKIIQNNKVVDVVQIPHFVRFLRSGHVAFTDKTSAQGIVGSDDKTLYYFVLFYTLVSFLLVIKSKVFI